MTVYAQWWGGTNYSVGTVDDDTEEFPSILKVRHALEDRYLNRDGQTPNVDLVNTNMWVFKYDPRGVHDAYPDFIIKLDSNGHARVTQA